MPDRDEDWVQEAVRLARASLAVESFDAVEELARRHGHRARLRGETLVLHPLDWLDDGVVRPDVDADEALEVELTGGDVEEARRRDDALLEELRRHLDERGAGDDVAAHHVYNAERFAEFCENHHRVAVEDVTPDHLREFVEQYYVRNVWPPEGAAEELERSLAVLLDLADRGDVAEAYGDLTTE